MANGNQLMFTAFWRQAIGMETVLVVCVTLWAILSRHIPSFVAVGMMCVYTVLLLMWVKYWRMEEHLGVPRVY